jgi:hypothetical protein
MMSDAKSIVPLRSSHKAWRIWMAWASLFQCLGRVEVNLILEISNIFKLSPEIIWTAKTSRLWLLQSCINQLWLLNPYGPMDSFQHLSTSFISFHEDSQTEFACKVDLSSNKIAKAFWETSIQLIEFTCDIMFSEPEKEKSESSNPWKVNDLSGAPKLERLMLKANPISKLQDLEGSLDLVLICLKDPYTAWESSAIISMCQNGAVVCRLMICINDIYR